MVESLLGGVFADLIAVVVAFAANWFIQSSLVIAAGLLVGGALRRRGSAVQSAIYRTTLVVALACPLATFVLSLAGVSGWSIGTPELIATAASEPLSAPDATALAAPIELPPASDAELNTPPSPMGLAPAPTPRATPQRLAMDLVATPPLLEPEATPIDAAPVRSAATNRLTAFGLLAVVALAAWGLVAAALSLRLAASWRALGALRRDAALADAATLGLCGDLATRIGVGPPDVLRSPYLPSPCLAGVRRPAVLLPEAEDGASIEDVLVHELAHLKRRDTLWNLLRRLATATLFFQPLLWRLSRRIEATAEEVCDDYVVAFGSDRADYADRLLTIAELGAAPMAPAGVGMVSFRSMLGRRVARVLDTSRPLSTRVGALLLTLVIVGGLFGAAGAGLVGLGAGVAEASGQGDAIGEKLVAEEPDNKDPSDDASADTQDAATEWITRIGRVVDEAGRPVPGATVKVMWTRGNIVPVLSGASLYEREQLGQVTADDEGRFRVRLPKVEIPLPGSLTQHREPRLKWKVPDLIATSPGYAPDWVSLNRDAPGSQIVLTLSKSTATIRGRLIDIEGQPIEGVRVDLTMLARGEPERIAKWAADVETLRAEGKLPTPDRSPALSMFVASTAAPPAEPTNPEDKPRPNYPAREHLRGGLAADRLGATTNADGRFELTGLPTDQLATLLIHGPGVQQEQVNVVTRDMAAFTTQRARCYGAVFEHVASPGLTINGVVRDADSGEPIVGAAVTSYLGANSTMSMEGRINDVTDDEGRFQIAGMPIGKGNLLKVTPAQGQPYLTRDHIEAPESNGEAVEVDVALRRGVLLTGRVTDAESGEPVQATVHVHPLLDNPHAKAYASLTPNIFRMAQVGETNRTASDGSFQLVAIPGKSIVGVYPMQMGTYCSGLGAEELADWRTKGQYPTFDHCDDRVYARLAPISVEVGTEELALDLTVSRGQKVTLRPVDPAGDPIAGVRASNLTPFGFSGAVHGATAVEVVALRPDETRPVILLDQERRLSKVVAITAPKATPPTDRTVRLEPCATVKARLVDGEGAPVVGLLVRADLLPSGSFGATAENAVSDENGEITFRYLPAGGPFRLGGSHPDHGWVNVAEELNPKPGEEIDLGEIDVTTTDRPAIKRTSGAGKAAAAVAEEEQAEAAPLPKAETGAAISGTVTLPNGQPAADAHVAIVAMSRRSRSGGEFGPYGEVLAEGDVDRDGEFTLSVRDVSSKTHRAPRLLVQLPHYGLAWRDVDLDKRATDVAIELPEEQPVKLRLIDLEGRPAAGVRVYPVSVTRRVASGERASRDGASFGGKAASPEAWAPSAITDRDGRVTLRGIPDGCGVFAEIEGGELYADQGLMLNTGEPEERGKQDATYRPLVKNGEPGEELQLVLGPAQWFEGTVTYEDTGEPAPLARLTIWASQQAPASSMSLVAGRADAQGRYRIKPKPGIRFGVNAYPPSGEPYLPRRLPHKNAIHWTDGDRLKQHDVTLPRGVLVRGRVVEAGSGEGIGGASVQYKPETINNPNATEDILTGWQAIVGTDAEGRFETAVLPGPGRLLVQESSGRFVKRMVGGREISTGKPGGSRNYLAAIEFLDPEVDARVVDAEIELEPAAMVRGKLIDERGEPIKEALVISSFTGMRNSLTWRGQIEPTLGGRFEIGGLKEGQALKVHFLAPERRLGATVTVSGGQTDLEIVLLPCGEATVRFVDAEGKPIAGARAGMHFVATPGAYTYDYEASRRGEFLDDADFISNLDPTNYWPAPMADQDGKLVLPALIPGATYRLYPGRTLVIGGKALPEYQDFQVESGKTFDLGEFTRDDDE